MLSCTCSPPERSGGSHYTVLNIDKIGTWVLHMYCMTLWVWIGQQHAGVLLDFQQKQQAHVVENKFTLMYATNTLWNVTRDLQQRDNILHAQHSTVQRYIYHSVTIIYNNINWCCQRSTAKDKNTLYGNTAEEIMNHTSTSYRSET